MAENKLEAHSIPASPPLETKHAGRLMPGLNFFLSFHKIQQGTGPTCVRRTRKGNAMIRDQSPLARLSIFLAVQTICAVGLIHTRAAF